MNHFYLQSAHSAMEHTQSRREGLTSAEAEERIRQNGKNKLAEGKTKSLAVRFMEQLANPMIIILIIAAIVSGVTAAYSGESLTDVFIILAVVIINAVLGVLQESKAEKAIKALQEMSSAMSKVYRDGELIQIKSEDVVIGDIILLEAGDSIPADARIIENASLKIEEAALTGESVPVNKTVDIITKPEKGEIPLGDRVNMVYMGSSVAYGRGLAVITAVGMGTEMGKIADAITKAKDNQTPLQIKLGQLSKVLSFAVVGICAFIFAFSMIKAGSFNADVALDTFMIAVSLAVAAIPEGLAAVVTIVLSIGVTNMSKRNAVIRKLTAVETLGCAEIICSDKTGTLTQNKMTVVESYSDDTNLLACSMALCSDAELSRDNKATGEPTECALVNYAFSVGIDKNKQKESQPRISELPFDSGRKMMSTFHKVGDSVIQYTKGAPDIVISRCSYYHKDGKPVLMDDKKRSELLAANKSMADKALRVLCAAYRVYDSLPEGISDTANETGLVFIGLVGMIDPIRPEVKAAIEECRTAGIRPVMITGDHRDTAVAIAKQLGILTSESGALTGSELSLMSDEEFNRRVGEFSVYARVQPEHKVRIVKAWKRLGKVTAMTGDGVNDAPSIKTADIGVGMGITGTDVTKNVADMVLADDNFATIVSAVGEGRRIYDNIRKSIQFLLASNLSEVLSVFTATVLGFTILQPVHILWINLITDCFPALALGMEKGEPDIMKRKPRSAKEGIFSGGLGLDVVYQGIVVTLLTLTAYFVGHFMESGRFEIVNSADGMTMAFLTMSMAEIFHSFNMRSQRKSLFSLKKQNLFLIGAMLLSLTLTTAVIYVPFLTAAFGFESISVAEYFVSLGIAVAIVPIVELVKFIQRKTA